MKVYKHSPLALSRRPASLKRAQVNIYLGENTGENRDYAGHLGINLPAGSEVAAASVLYKRQVAGYGELDSKFHGLLAAAGYVVDAGDEANKQALKENIFYTGDEAGTWTIKLDTAVLGEEKVEFLVTVKMMRVPSGVRTTTSAIRMTLRHSCIM